MTYDMKAEKIRQFLQTRDLINKRQLALMAEIDPANFHRWLNEQTPWRISQDGIDKLIPIIKQYGYR